jgi:phosphoribosylformylglycinamidine synthase
MAVVVSQKDATKFIELADAENLDATIVATVTDKKRVDMTWNGKNIVSLSREFLNSNGVQKHAIVKIEAPTMVKEEYTALGQEEMASLLRDLSFCSQKDL